MTNSSIPIIDPDSAPQIAGARADGHTISAYIDGIGLIGPGIADWSVGKRMLMGDVPYQHHATVLTPPPALPSAERRRCGPIVKLSLAVGYQAAESADLDVAHLATVFSASGGDGYNCHEICAMLASDDRQISPTRFHNSVHNAAAGYWGIATGAMASSSVLCAHDASFGAGLLEAVTQAVVDRSTVLLITADTSYPEPLRAARPIPDEFGIGLVISPERSASSIAQISIALVSKAAGSHTGSASNAEAEAGIEVDPNAETVADLIADADADSAAFENGSTRMTDSALENLRTAIPAARGLPLLQAIAREQSGRVLIDYLHNVDLSLDVAPCR